MRTWGFNILKQFATTELGRTCIHNGKEKEKIASHNPKAWVCGHIKLKMKLFCYKAGPLNNRNITSFSKNSSLPISNWESKWRTPLATFNAYKEPQFIYK